MSDYVLACCCIRDSFKFDMQHDHVLKMIFDLLIAPQGRCGVGGGAKNIKVTTRP